MKRIFAMILVLACLFGLVACEINTSATTANTKPTAAELKEKSTIVSALSACDSLLVTERVIFDDGEASKSTAYFEKSDEGITVALSEVVDGKTEELGTFKNGAYYMASDDVMMFGILMDENTALAPWDETYGLPDLTDANPTVTYKGDTATLTVTVTDDYDEILTYTYCASITTLLPISLTIEVKDENGDLYETIEHTYTYPTDYTPSLASYDAITGAKDAITLTVIIDPKGAATTRTYTISASCIIMAMGTDGTLCGVYSDIDCTQFITSLPETTGDSATVYVAPYEFTTE